jgi:hypothetical protein
MNRSARAYKVNHAVQFSWQRTTASALEKNAAALRSSPLPWRRSGKRRREEGQGEVRGDGNGRGGVR